jgi:hypothetical protein
LLGVRSIINFQFFRLRETVTDGLLSEQLVGSALPPWQRSLQLINVHLALLHLGRVEEAVRIADELEPLARKIGQSLSVALCLSTRAWIDFGKAPDLAKLETGIQQVSTSDQKPWSAFWEPFYKVQLSLVDFFRGNRVSALLHAQASCRPEVGLSLEGLGVGTFFRQTAYAGDHDGAFAILDEKRTRLLLAVNRTPEVRG